MCRGFCFSRSIVLNSREDEYDAIILGAGGAGLMCAAIAGQRGKRVLVVDHAEEAGKKILISGGGRCNFTNRYTEPDCYLSANPHFAKSALSRYSPADFIALVDRYKINWHEKELGQLFCDGPAKQIVAMLLDECKKNAIEFNFGQSVADIGKLEGSYQVRISGRTVTARNLVIATGGPSIPKMGATEFAYDLARSFGLKVVTPRPALVPLKLGDEDSVFRALSGLSTEVIARCGRTKFQGPLLFTHKGFSGPVILQISSYWAQGQEVDIDFLPTLKSGWLVKKKQESPRATLRAALSISLPDRLAAVLAEWIGLSGELANQSDRVLESAEKALSNWHFKPVGSEGFAKAEVTAGGISTSELSSQTMQAKNMPGLYVIGEAVDVTGWLGGYNFQWAWASGWAAGQSL